MTMVGSLVPASVAAAKPRGERTQGLGDRPLRQGATGPDVKELQLLLTKAGLKVEADGSFGPSTTAAVKRFQRATKLEDSGVVGRKTVSALRGATDVEAAVHLTTGGYNGTGRRRARVARSLGDRIPVRRGMSGQDIRVLQDFLRRAGQQVNIDGEFGTGTWRAVRAFETANALPVDGTVDAGDIDVLRGQAAAGTNAPTAEAPLTLAPGDQAQLGPDGLAIAPANAPEPVKQLIAAGNRIAKMPYIYGGGHGKWEDRGYDCSGSVSYALHGGGLLEQSMPSGGFTNWGAEGPGQWVTIYANSGHMYMVVAGLRFDTSGAKQTGSRWQTEQRPTQGYSVRHPEGL
jgi:peptidoglycan hydrolase-like protein with peptidoglycan-binding domain